MKETDLRQKMVKEAKKQGYWIRSVNDRFNSGYPDLRIKTQSPQMDMELKVCRIAASSIRHGNITQSGISKLQAIELRDMNKAGIPAVGVLYFPREDWFTFTNYYEFDAWQALADHSIEGNKGRPDFEVLTRHAMHYLMEQGYSY